MKSQGKAILFLFFTLIFINSFGQDTQTINGVLVDNEGNPVPGATVMVKGTTIGTMTNSNGEFQIKIPTGSEIFISFVGMNTISHKATGYSNIRINLETGLVTFCCMNHSPKHCSGNMKEMKKMAKENGCIFK